MNALMHNIEIDDAITVDTASELAAAINVMRDAAYVDLCTTYIVERIKETLSDGSTAHSLRIRQTGSPV